MPKQYGNMIIRAENLLTCLEEGASVALSLDRNREATEHMGHVLVIHENAQVECFLQTLSPTSVKLYPNS